MTHFRRDVSLPDLPHSRSRFEQFGNQGAPFYRAFLEPVVLSINYAKTLGYSRFVTEIRERAHIQGSSSRTWENNFGSSDRTSSLWL